MSKKTFLVGLVAGAISVPMLLRGNILSELDTLTKYDVTGDGIGDYIVGSGAGVNQDTLNVGYVDGREVLTHENPSGPRKHYMAGYKINNLVEVNLPGVKERSPSWFTSRTFTVRPTQHGENLEIVVSDGTTDGPSFDKVTSTSWRNPNYGK